MNAFAAAWRHARALLAFGALPAAQRRLVVYSEGPAYWPHLGPVVQALLARHERPFAYVSSSPADPGLAIRHPRLAGFEIGEGLARTVFFNGLEAGLVLMTMPDLGRFHLKRSPRVGGYAYLHHSLVSHHMVYREGAFDHYDTILCAGPHHAEEMRAIEALHGLAPKELVAHGYGRLDTLLAAGAAAPAGPRPLVVVAPSWGPEGLLERHAGPLLAALAGSRWDVVVRPHPQTVRLAPAAMAVVRKACAQAPNLRLDDGVAGHESLQRATLMVSDWSGAAFDFALGFERPVLFVDVPRKVNNPHHARLAIEPIEVFGREALGAVLDPAALAELPARLDALAAGAARYRDAIRAFRERWVHHPGRSAEVAADWLAAQGAPRAGG